MTRRTLAYLLLAALAPAVAGCRGCAEAHDVAYEELGPRALRKKYEWFKDQAAALDKAAADVRVYDARVKAIEAPYAGVARDKWARDDREAHRQAQAELVGLKARYNRLAAEYNAQHAKINWAFADAGQVPDGGRPLPREYRTYLEN